MNREVYASGRDQMDLYLMGKVLGNRIVNLEDLRKIINVPVACMTDDCAQFWGNLLGVLEEFEVVGGNMWVRVCIDLTFPLSKRIQFLMKDLGKERRYRAMWFRYRSWLRGFTPVERNRYKYGNNMPSSKAEASNAVVNVVDGDRVGSLDMQSEEAWVDNISVAKVVTEGEVDLKGNSKVIQS
ncbi:hypothetical protein PanWU01x14_289650 [Parasponia andersonii]|uniref:Uncharacterized protein n=1 Tax=Parasponia andersonii TaxID=3476 RepID=A0A2P5AY10_PARAD|nr:hypothetical protein PanWU01x14_289650 [Parasponia andersonii]